MAKSTTNRAAARDSATGAAAASGSTEATGAKRRPGDRPEDGSTTEAADQPTAAPVNRDLIVISTNPKRKGTKAYMFFEKYPRKGVLSTIDAARADSQGKELVRGKDLSWDSARRHILVGQEATDFPVSGTREEQCAYLLGLPETEAGFKLGEKEMIAWGYMDAPAPVVEAAKEEVKAEEAAAS